MVHPAPEGQRQFGPKSGSPLTKTEHSFYNRINELDTRVALATDTALDLDLRWVSLAVPDAAHTQIELFRPAAGTVGKTVRSEHAAR
jgi:hypothetical protein